MDIDVDALSNRDILINQGGTRAVDTLAALFHPDCR